MSPCSGVTQGVTEGKEEGDSLSTPLEKLRDICAVIKEGDCEGRQGSLAEKRNCSLSKKRFEYTNDICS